jgi:hypothetical protein
MQSSPMDTLTITERTEVESKSFDTFSTVLSLRVILYLIILEKAISEVLSKILYFNEKIVMISEKKMKKLRNLFCNLKIFI